MKKTELVKYAKDNNITIDETCTKSEILKTIKG
jgi:hypothetical protein